MERTGTLSGELQTYIATLEKEVTQLKNTVQNNVIQFLEHEKRFKEYEKEAGALKTKNEILEEKLRLALYRQFGRGTERYTGKDQLNLFVENPETGRENKAPEMPPVEVKGYERNKPGRKKPDEKIPRVIVEIDIDEEDSGTKFPHCACGHKLVYIGYDISEKLIIIPEQVFVVQFHIKKFACKNCEGSGDEEKKAVRSGKIPGNIIPGGIATPELLSFVFTKKYCDYLPYYPPPRKRVLGSGIPANRGKYIAAGYEQLADEDTRKDKTVDKIIKRGIKERRSDGDGRNAGTGNE